MALISGDIVRPFELDVAVRQDTNLSDHVANDKSTAESHHDSNLKLLPLQASQTKLLPVQSFQTVQLRFEHCGVQVRHSGGGLLARARSDKTTSFGSVDLEKSTLDNGWKAILMEVSGEICGGSLLAIMGPSGSGKSTLLSLLALTPNSGRKTGNLTLNGRKLDSSMLRQYCAFMPQEDHLWPFLTCRETLSFAADFFLSKPFHERSAEVDSLLRELGLEKCANTFCGNQFLKGLSGGQKRRLSLAISLIKQPVVLFLDEPTSGLDSASAASIVAFLKHYAQQQGVAVVCTIHQPSTAIFKQFDNTLLLSNGRIAYSGPVLDLARYFKEDVGFVFPPDYSLAESVLEAINCDFGDEQKSLQVDSLLDAWAACSAPGGPRCLSPQVPREPLPDRSSISTSLPAQATSTPTRALLRFISPLPDPAVNTQRQVWVQLRRQALLSWRDPILYVSRMVIFLVACIFFAWVYADARNRAQDQVVNRVFLCMWILAVPTCMAVIAVFGYNQELLELKREIRDGMYSPLAYIISNAILQIPFMVVLSLSALGVGAYCVANFHAPKFGTVLLIYSLTLWAFENMAQTMSLLFRNPLIGMLLFVCAWFMSFLFSGFFITETSLQWPLRIFMYIMPHRWSLASMVKIDFRDSLFGGAELDLTPGGQGYKCSNSALDHICFGSTGEQVLTTLSQTFTIFEPSETLGRDMLVVFGIGITYKILFAVLFHFKTKGGSPPMPAPAASAALRPTAR